MFNAAFGANPMSKNWDAGALPGIDAPLKLVAWLTYPERSTLGLEPYAFGWFPHPRVAAPCYLGWDELDNIMMYLTDQAGRDHLAQNFPLRYVLIQEYFKTVKVQTENAAGVPSVPTP